VISAADNAQVFLGGSHNYENAPTVDPARDSRTGWFELLEDSGYRFRYNFTAKHAPTNTDLAPYFTGYTSLERSVEIGLQYSIADAAGMLSVPDVDGERSAAITIECEIKLERQRKKERGRAMIYETVRPNNPELCARMKVTKQFEMAWTATAVANEEGRFRLPPSGPVVKRQRGYPAQDSPYVLIKRAMNDVVAANVESNGPDNAARPVLRPGGGLPLQGSPILASDAAALTRRRLLRLVR
jgi:hypothetical protein